MAAVTDSRRAAAIRLQQVETEAAVAEAELERLKAEIEKYPKVDHVEASKSVASGVEPSALANAILKDALLAVEADEKALAARLERSTQKEVLTLFLTRKDELAAEEERLTRVLQEHEDLLIKIRERLANPPQSFLPDDPVKAQLYVSWKKFALEKEELLAAGRRRKLDALQEMRLRHENQIIALDAERRKALGSVGDAVEKERAKITELKQQLAALDDEISESKTALGRFQSEFEQLRVALLVDRMAKGSQVAGLVDRRKRLAAEVGEFDSVVAQARQRVIEEETRVWEAKIAAEREAGAVRIEKEKAVIRQRMEQVKASLAEQYSAGFAPLLEEAEARHQKEMQAVAALQRTLEDKEAELRAAQAACIAAASPSEDRPEVVPEETLREFEELRAGVVTLWDQLSVPAESVFSFLSECDLLAPYHPRVLELYTNMYKQVTGRSAPPPLTLPPSDLAKPLAGTDALPPPVSASSPSVASPRRPTIASLYDTYRTDASSRAVTAVKSPHKALGFAVPPAKTSKKSAFK